MSPHYTTVGGYPNTDPYYISPEEEAAMEEDRSLTAILGADVIEAAHRLDKSSLHDYAVKAPHHFPNDARLVARALLAALKQEGLVAGGEQDIAKRCTSLPAPDGKGDGK